MDIRTTTTYEILGPLTLCWILTYYSVSQAISVDLAGFEKQQVTTPYNLVPSHNNSSRVSNLRSTLYMWSSLCTVWLPYSNLLSTHICHITSTVSQFLLTIWMPNSPLLSPYRLFYIQWCWINYKSRHIQVRTFLSRTFPVSLHTAVNEPTQQHTAVRYDCCLRWTAMIFCHNQTVTHFNSSPCRSQVQFISSICCVRTFRWACWTRWQDW